jgi:hypothetical protein
VDVVEEDRSHGDGATVRGFDGETVVIVGMRRMLKMR